MTMGRIHENEGYPSKHEAQVKGDARKQKMEVYFKRIFSVAGLLAGGQLAC